MFFFVLFNCHTVTFSWENTTFIGLYLQTNTGPQEYSCELEEGSNPLACISFSKVSKPPVWEAAFYAWKWLRVLSGSEVMQTAAQNCLSKHSEWKFITLTSMTLNSNFTTQFTNTMVRICCDLNTSQGSRSETWGNIWLHTENSLETFNVT